MQLLQISEIVTKVLIKGDPNSSFPHVCSNCCKMFLVPLQCGPYGEFVPPVISMEHEGGELTQVPRWLGEQMLCLAGRLADAQRAQGTVYPHCKHTHTKIRISIVEISYRFYGGQQVHTPDAPLTPLCLLIASSSQEELRKRRN
ncbi:hypothetical protein JZ751_003821 [Albula glossodonta]|uniref:Uncharacterized protein n=1 Tax=Albula glossodonta TaxID=121402 RepID=A0A8T2P7Y9_9TELE|nr:hypothetical protein JZ751_003821 [Albula glossodonta]